MRTKKHMQALIELLKDIRKEPGSAVIGFIYSTALVHMFHITFESSLDPGWVVKHNDFKSKRRANKLKSLLPDFEGKNKLFSLWKEMESERNGLCYGDPSGEDIDDYVSQFYKIKKILEGVAGVRFEIGALRDGLEELKNEE